MIFRLSFLYILLLIHGCGVNHASSNRAAMVSNQDPARATINISSIYFTQNSINPTFTNGTHVKAVIRDLSNDVVKLSDLPAMRVIKYLNPKTNEAIYFTLDNRRLYAMKNSKYANAEVEVQMASKQEVIEEYWKITSQSDGHTVIVTSSPDKGLYPPEGTILNTLRTKIDEARVYGC